jgi:hypothetical protein
MGRDDVGNERCGRRETGWRPEGEGAELAVRRCVGMVWYGTVACKTGFPLEYSSKNIHLALDQGHRVNLATYG